MRALLAILLSCLALSAAAVIETYDFAEEQQRERYQRFVEELRCPKCQNQNLEGSNSPIASDLRRELHRLISEGHSDADIQQFMLDRYGDFILYRPRLTARTLALWGLPLLLLVIGGLTWWVQLRRGAASREPLSPPPLSAEEQQRIERLLSENRDD